MKHTKMVVFRTLIYLIMSNPVKFQLLPGGSYCHLKKDIPFSTTNEEHQYCLYFKTTYYYFTPQAAPSCANKTHLKTIGKN